MIEKNFFMSSFSLMFTKMSLFNSKKTCEKRPTCAIFVYIFMTSHLAKDSIVNKSEGGFSLKTVDT